MEDRKKSTPVICANKDFFWQPGTLKNTAKMRLEKVVAGSIRDFHRAFHRTG
jgi:hypothetical protein